MQNYLAAINWANIGIGCAFFSIPVLFIALSIPMLFDKIPPNNWYGFRTPKTFSDKEIWYKANRYMARDLLVLGITHLVFAIFLVLLTDFNCKTPDAEEALIMWVLGYTGIPTIGMALMVVRGLLYLKKL